MPIWGDVIASDDCLMIVKSVARCSLDDDLQGQAAAVLPPISVRWLSQRAETKGLL